MLRYYIFGGVEPLSSMFTCRIGEVTMTGDRYRGRAKADARTVTLADVVESDSEEERERLLADIVSSMTLDEKIRQMSGDTGLLDIPVMLVRYNLKPFDSGENPGLGIPAISFTDGPRGVSVGHSTCFPVSMARGATWDPELEERVGSAMGVEARAQGANFSGAVCINIPRHPGWGRAQETFGEDPYHVGEMGVAMVNGLQRHVMACAKHFACNSIEEARFSVDVRVEERALREVYLPHFKRCVQAGVASVMSAYNKVNGQYCGHSRHLLRDILKGDWEFDGFVMSDFMLGVRNGGDAVNGGLDIEMPFRWRFGRGLKRALGRGEVPVKAIDEAVTRVLRQKARFALVGDGSGYNRGKVACREHCTLALEVARKSIVLLKNKGEALPLDRGDIGRIAVIGELADRANLGDMQSSRVRPPYTVTPLEGIGDRAGDSVEVIYESGRDLIRAGKAAREADAAVVVVGLTHRDEGEAIPVVNMGGDRENLDLSAGHESLIKAVAAETGRCVVVLEAGSAVTMESWKDRVEAILMVWYPGMEGGSAVADILFGDVNPSGKLPITFPESTGQLPFFDRKAASIEYGYYHGYRLFDRDDLEPAFRFGFGLSYTEYRYGNLRLGAKEITGSGSVEALVDVTNAGQVAGEEVVQLYVGCRGSAVDRPIRELKGFARLPLEPGETRTHSFKLEARDLAYYDVASGEWKTEEAEYEVFVGPSSGWGDLRLRDTFRITGP